MTQMQVRPSAITLLILFVIGLPGCGEHIYTAPQLERDWSNYHALGNSQPCAELCARERHSSYSMHLLAQCFETGWSGQSPDFDKARSNHLRAARCGDPDSLAWLELNRQLSAAEREKLVLVEHKRNGDDFEVHIPRSATQDGTALCNLRYEQSPTSKVFEPVRFLVDLALLPLCIVSNAGCPFFQRKYFDFEPTDFGSYPYNVPGPGETKKADLMGPACQR